MAITGAIVAGSLMAGASVGGGIMANKAMKKAQERADAATAKAIAELQSVGVPNMEAQKIILQNPQLVFKFDPELEQYYELGRTKMEDIAVDPRLKDAQMSALDKLQNLGIEGLTASEQADLRMMRSGVAREAQARDAAILQNLSERGQLGAGQEIAMRAMSSQQGAQRQSEETDRMAKMANDRALQAILQSGELGGQMRGQEFGEQSQVAQAQDAISKFNVANRQDVQGRNVQSKNLAALETERLKQALEEQRAATANQQEIYNKELLQQEFENKMRKAEAMSGAYTGQAGREIQSGATKAQNWNQMGQGVSSGIGTIYSGMGKK